MSSTSPPFPFIVLTTLPLGERDSLLRVVEPRGGTLSVVLRGARGLPGASGANPARRRNPGSASWRTLDLFDRAHGTLRSLRSGLPTIAQCERLPGFRLLREDLTKFAAANLFAEAVLSLFDEQSENGSSLFGIVENTLTAIDSAPSPRRALGEVTMGLVALLTLSGFGFSASRHRHYADATSTGIQQTPTVVPTPRLLREAIGSIEDARGRALRSAATLIAMVRKIHRSED